MFELCVRDHIAAAHFLRNYEGPCKNLHGHTWKIAVYIKSHQLNGTGMVADFADVKMNLKSFLAHLDHVCLNDLPYFKDVNPTTENLAKYIYAHFSKMIVPLKLTKVEVWESDTSSITYTEE